VRARDYRVVAQMIRGLPVGRSYPNALPRWLNKVQMTILSSRGNAATPPLFLVGSWVFVENRQVSWLLDQGCSGLPTDVFQRLQWLFRLAPHGQWRDRAGFTPDFSITLFRAPVFHRIHLL
jgi:hypothetical protein